MTTVTLTKEQIQHNIDHYSATAEGFFQLMEEDPGNRETHFLKNQFYAGKADAWIDIYNILFPEMEKDRAYPLNEEDKQKIMTFGYTEGEDVKTASGTKMVCVSFIHHCFSCT